jgi:phage gp36-like protein
MAYCSNTAIYTALPKLPNTTTVTAVIDLHTRRTDGLINGKCARRYSVPFNPVPPFIRTIAEDIVCYFIMRTYYSQDAQNKSEYLEEFKDKALEDLDAIMEGKIDLVDTSGSAVPMQTEEITDQVSSNTQKFQPFFDVDDTLEWKFNDDLLDEIDANR